MHRVRLRLWFSGLALLGSYGGPQPLRRDGHVVHAHAHRVINRIGVLVQRIFTPIFDKD